MIESFQIYETSILAIEGTNIGILSFTSPQLFMNKYKTRVSCVIGYSGEVKKIKSIYEWKIV